MKKIFVLLLAAVMLISLAACTASSTTTTSSSITVNGETTTTTSTTTVGTDGVSHESSTTTVNEEGQARRERWHELFSEGAEGENANGEVFFFAYDNPENLSYGAIMILNADMSELQLYDFGEIVIEDEWLVIEDVEGETSLPFAIPDTEVENGFELAFQDGDGAVMHFVDQDTIIEDMNRIIDSLVPDDTSVEEAEESGADEKIDAGGKISSDGMGAQHPGTKNTGALKVTAEDPTGLRGVWPEIFAMGAEGVSDIGSRFLFAFDDPDNMKKAAFMILSDDGSECYVYLLGTVIMTDEGPVLDDDYDDMYMYFDFDNADEDGFDMIFRDGDIVHMQFEDQAAIINDMVSVVEAGLT